MQQPVPLIFKCYHFSSCYPAVPLFPFRARCLRSRNWRMAQMKWMARQRRVPPWRLLRWQRRGPREGRMTTARRQLSLKRAAPTKRSRRESKCSHIYFSCKVEKSLLLIFRFTQDRLSNLRIIDQLLRKYDRRATPTNKIGKMMKALSFIKV